MASGTTYRVNVGDVLRATFFTMIDVQFGLTHFDYHVTSKINASVTMDDVALAVDNLNNGAFKACLPASVTYYGTKVHAVNNTPQLPGNTHVNAGAGTTGTTCLPTGVSGLIRKKGAFAQRRFQGRMFVPFPPIEAMDHAIENRPNVAYIGFLTALHTLLNADLTVVVGADSATLHPVVYSKKFTTLSDINSCVSMGYWAQQHRRGDFGRANVGVPF